MARVSGAVAALCLVMLLIFAYSFWVGAQKPPEGGGPAASAQTLR